MMNQPVRPIRWIPPPQPEDKRPLHKAEGEVPAGFVRAEVLRRCWSSKERLFKGDIVDLSEADFELMHKREQVRQQWIKPTAKKQG
jgi:hypothetical protein